MRSLLNKIIEILCNKRVFADFSCLLRLEIVDFFCMSDIPTRVIKDCFYANLTLSYLTLSQLMPFSISEHEGGGGSESSVGDLFAKNMPRRMKTKRASDQPKNQVIKLLNSC